MADNENKSSLSEGDYIEFMANELHRVSDVAPVLFLAAFPVSEEDIPDSTKEKRDMIAKLTGVELSDKPTNTKLTVVINSSARNLQKLICGLISEHNELLPVIEAACFEAQSNIAAVEGDLVKAIMFYRLCTQTMKNVNRDKKEGTDSDKD